MWKTRWGRIEEVEAERISKSSVWICGRRNAIRSSCDAYHETWEAAHEYILGVAKTGLLKAQRDLDRARSKLETVKAMKPNAAAHLRAAKEKT